MADFNLPLASSLYVDVLTYLKLRDIDALTLCFNEPTNIPDHSFKYERNLNVFQAYEGGTWRNKVLSVLGGGTGATNPNDIRINLGLGSMALQAASAVAITGGTMNGVAITNATALTTAAGVSATIAANLNVGNNVTALQFYGAGSNISGLNAAALTYNIAPTARLGTGAANSGSFLRGDSTWQPIVVPPSRWTELAISTSLEVTAAIVNAQTLITCFNSVPIYINLPPIDGNLANPRSALRIHNYYGVDINVYQQGGSVGHVGGRNPFLMNVPHMSIDLLPNGNAGVWSIF